MHADPRFKPLPIEPATLLTEGRLPEAVKVLRESHGLSARDAKRWIDWHIDQNPVLRVQLEAQQRATRRRWFLWFLVVDVLIVAGYLYWKFQPCC